VLNATALIFLQFGGKIHKILELGKTILQQSLKLLTPAQVDQFGIMQASNAYTAH
jgi:hypothetical protein